MPDATDPVEILQDLIAIPSVNPMGGDANGPIYFEARMTQYLSEFFDQLGVEHQVFEVSPSRANVIARFDSPGSETTVLLDAHQDTVPVAGMTIDPFDPVLREGRIYGRGACDVKGGMAAMLAAFTRLVHDRPAGAANVVMSCTCDEEATVTGIRDLVKLWRDPTRSGSLLNEPPYVAEIAEPTDLDVVVAHRGATRWKIRTTGRACHSSKPAEGVNAIYRMAQVLRCLEDYADQLVDMVDPHPLCGPATLSVGKINGGMSVNIVPDECTIEVDRRVVPGEDGAAVIEQLRDFLKERLEFEPEFLPPWILGEPLSDDGNGSWANRLLGEITAVAGEHQKVGVPYGTHASRVAGVGVPSMVCHTL